MKALASPLPPVLDALDSEMVGRSERQSSGSEYQVAIRDKGAGIQLLRHRSCQKVVKSLGRQSRASLAQP